jgi:hypothetical protein
MKKMVAVCIGAAFAWLETHGTPSQWLERAQRVPLPVLREQEGRFASRMAVSWRSRSIRA